MTALEQSEELKDHPHAQFFRENPTYEPVHTTPNPLTVLAEADKIVNGSRQTDYGTGEKNLTRIAAMWSAYLGTHISPRQVSMMMVLLKVSRDAHKEKRDNLVDLAGYAALAEQVSQ